MFLISAIAASEVEPQHSEHAERDQTGRQIDEPYAERDEDEGDNLGEVTLRHMTSYSW
jgi:hypothetical protein